MSAPTPAPHEVDLTPRPALEAVTIPPPTDWVERVTEVAALDGMPPLRMAPADTWQSRGRWVLHPWWLLHDASALLMWAQHLDDDVEAKVWRIPGQQGGIVVHGAIAGHPTALVGHSWRLDIDATARPPLAMPIAALERLAHDEAAASDTAPRPPKPLPVLGRIEWRPGPDVDWFSGDLLEVMGDRGRANCMLLVRLDVNGRTELVDEQSTRPLVAAPAPAPLFEPVVGDVVSAAP